MRKIDPIILLLTGLLIFFTAVLIVCEHYFYQDAVSVRGRLGVTRERFNSHCSWASRTNWGFRIRRRPGPLRG